MFRTAHVLLLTASCLTTRVAISQGATGCEALLAQGVYDGIQQSATNSSASTYHQAICTGTVQQSSGGSSTGGGASIVIPGVNIPLGLNFNDAQNFQNTYKSAFCSGIDTSVLTDQSLRFLSSVASPVLVQGYNACVIARNKGLQSFTTIAPDNKSVRFELWFTPIIHPNDSATIGRVSIVPAGNATCRGIIPNTRLGLDHSTLICTRTNNSGVSIVVPTSQGDLSAFLTPTPPPPSTTQVVMSALPKGIILPWSDPSLAIPNGWHICDGTNGTPNLMDDRILQGSTIPNLGKLEGNNDGYSFHVGGTTGKAGSSKPDGFKVDDNRGCCPQVSGLDHTHSFDAHTDAATINLKHYNVVWIMKTI
ncbi:hypothetical protein [Acidipila sp. EB88]|uniref:hypothetical protein n=1 Tax=Acidipila sp. EB88 TaxID=2305226 RepID=UPI000F5E96BA|nr:hypothetical protein [Acidipila sp. EB88]